MSTSSPPPIVVILAAGLGTRMKSRTAKVLHQVAGRPLVCWPVELACALGARRIVCVLGHQKDAVAAVLSARYGAAAVTIAEQAEPRGTGDAVARALPALAGEPDDARVLILSGDVPLLTVETAQALLGRQHGSPLALVSTRPPDPRGYGRLVRDESGYVVRVVEDRDASAAEKRIGEVNAGIYAVSLGFLREAAPALRPDNAQRELYLTDLVARAAEQDDVADVEAPFDEVAGVNDRVDLARVDAVARLRVAERWMREGVTIHRPETVSIDADVAAIGPDTELGPGVSLRGAGTQLGAGVVVEQGSVLSDTVVADGAHIRPYCVLTSAQVGPRAIVGPFAHCRPGTELGEDVHLGNFVETKKARLGAGSKANHLAYLGDAVIGARVNVGAGTITCNYDGVKKSVTTLEDDVFIGSDTQLVAPVTVKKGAYVGAGATVTRDVPEGALYLTRAPEKVVEGYAERKKRRKS